MKKTVSFTRIATYLSKWQGVLVLPVWGDSSKVLVLFRFVFLVYYNANQDPKGSFLRKLDIVIHSSYKLNE